MTKEGPQSGQKSASDELKAWRDATMRELADGVRVADSNHPLSVSGLKAHRRAQRSKEFNSEVRKPISRLY